jgi:ADP-heptose:LPS heptosyltransferase
MRILLKNTQPLLGDRMMFTPVVRDLKASYPDCQIGVISAGPEIWDNNPHIDRSITEHNADHVYDIGPGRVTRGSKTNGLHITAAFRESLVEKAEMPIRQGPFKPDIHLSVAEKAMRLVDGRYWVINIDTGPFTAKRWPAARFQQVVDSLRQITFVQVGLDRDNMYRLTGDNVIDLVNKTKIRELFSLVYNAEGCISLVSSLMHVAAAFDKPCVVVAGGREPPTFERYAMHRYIDSVGTMPCCRNQACWHNALSACKNHDGATAKCMDLITVAQVVAAVESYYAGGALEAAPGRAPARRRPVLRIVANIKFLGGAERSVVEIAKMFVRNNWRVELSPAGDRSPDVLAALPPAVAVCNHVSRPCDVLLMYASDMVYNFDAGRFDVFHSVNAGRKVMALTYKVGKAGEAPWSRGWDKYLFLSSALRDGFLAKTGYGVGVTRVLAPPVDMDPFLAIQRPSPAANNQLPIHIVRHSSQGDKKFPADLPQIMAQCPVRFGFMPGPSWLQLERNVTKYPYSGDTADVAAFLAGGDCFWYLLPDGYTDQGPRVIVEAMAAGLPVIAEKRDGPADRVTTETGWLIDSRDQAVEIINSLTPEILAEKGLAARERAKTEFAKEKWFDAILEGADAKCRS